MPQLNLILSITILVNIFIPIITSVVDSGLYLHLVPDLFQLNLFRLFDYSFDLNFSFSLVVDLALCLNLSLLASVLVFGLAPNCRVHCCHRNHLLIIVPSFQIPWPPSWFHHHHHICLAL